MTFGTYDWCNDGAQDERHHVCPRGKCDILLDHNNKTEDKASNKDGNVPPPRCFLVVLGHVFVVTVIVTTLLCALERLDNVLAPEKDTVKDKGTDLTGISLSKKQNTLSAYRSIGHKHGISKGASQSGKTKLQETLFIEDSTLKNLSNRICRTILHQETSRHERKRPGAPTIAVVDTQHNDVADKESDSHMGLER
ncbi:unnamed protein product [Fusarium graminearum]|nr:unnamed protein product [Fusarium graminearum]CAG1977488.1 unnamed protein product [Fusarium graminearum]VTO92424.1 unnamed protein product [Fusarium graminearum]